MSPPDSRDNAEARPLWLDELAAADRWLVTLDGRDRSTVGEHFGEWKPSRATELTAVFLDRNVAEILARRPGKATEQQKQELAAIIHLCGAGPARVFARRGFFLTAGERCGDHDVAAYLAQINAMKREFQRFAVNERSGVQ
jgi:hypothetical protein